MINKDTGLIEIQREIESSELIINNYVLAIFLGRLLKDISTTQKSLKKDLKFLLKDSFNKIVKHDEIISIIRKVLLHDYITMMNYNDRVNEIKEEKEIDDINWYAIVIGYLECMDRLGEVSNNKKNSIIIYR